VFLNHGAWQRPVWHGNCLRAAGFMPLPSIAYRLARIAVGDGIANAHPAAGQRRWTFAVRHALLMAAGGVLVAEDGETGLPTTNLARAAHPPFLVGSPLGRCRIAGSRTMARQPGEPRRETASDIDLAASRARAILNRAAGCLLGVAIGGGSRA